MRCSGTLAFPPTDQRCAGRATAGWIAPAAAALVLVSFGFKLALAPFHLWAPDIYQGAPAPTTALVATVSKGAMFALLLRFYRPAAADVGTPLFWTFTVIAIASMFTGNLLAMRQTNIKRIMAYSSIAHMGYLLVAFLAGGRLAAIAVAFYLVSYFVATIGVFGVVGRLSGPARDADRMSDYRGLAWRHPWLAGVLAGSLLSLAGIPITVGFFGKFYVLTAGIGSSLWLLAVVLVVNSVLGLYYYLRVIGAIYATTVAGKVREPVAAEPFIKGSGTSWAVSPVLGVVALLLVWLGVYPAPLLRLIEAMCGPCPW